MSDGPPTIKTNIISHTDWGLEDAINAARRILAAVKQAVSERHLTGEESTWAEIHEKIDVMAWADYDQWGREVYECGMAVLQAGLKGGLYADAGMQGLI